jgi:hypothetical protein
VIPLDQKTHPDDLEPSFLGNSIGHWEGNTLVVDIVGFNDKGWVLSGGIFHSDALHITERYTRVDYDTINYEATIEDKKVLTQPFKTSTTMMLREGTRLREYICPENNEDVQRLENFWRIRNSLNERRQGRSKVRDSSTHGCRSRRHTTFDNARPSPSTRMQVGR